MIKSMKWMLLALVLLDLTLPSYADQESGRSTYNFNDFNLEIFKGWQAKTQLKEMVKAEAANLEAGQLIKRYMALNEEYKGKFFIFYSENWPRAGEGIYMVMRIRNKTYSLTNLSTAEIAPEVLVYYKSKTERPLDLDRVYAKYAVPEPIELKASEIY